MKKRKIMTGLLVLTVAATTLIGGTLAFLTDKEGVSNQFKTGKVDVLLVEDFDPENAVLVPSKGASSTTEASNPVQKQVMVSLKKDSLDSWVRVHIAIPKILDEQYQGEKAKYQPLHYNFSSDATYNWTWGKTLASKAYDNTYTRTMDGIVYNVYVVTYKEILANKGDVIGATSIPAIHSVYMDQNVTNTDLENLNKALGTAGWNIKVAAEAVQAAGNSDPFAAFNSAFGTVGSYNADFDTTASDGNDDVSIVLPDGTIK